MTIDAGILWASLAGALFGLLGGQIMFWVLSIKARRRYGKEVRKAQKMQEEAMRKEGARKAHLAGLEAAKKKAAKK